VNSAKIDTTRNEILIDEAKVTIKDLIDLENFLRGNSKNSTNTSAGKVANDNLSIKIINMFSERKEAIGVVMKLKPKTVDARNQSKPFLPLFPKSITVPNKTNNNPENCHEKANFI
jgi:hypothetical protein